MRKTLWVLLPVVALVAASVAIGGGRAEANWIKKAIKSSKQQASVLTLPKPKLKQKRRNTR